MKQKWRCFSPFLLSPSSRRAWIEIFQEFVEKHTIDGVALLAEGVDRNPYINGVMSAASDVALLAEGVDRNSEIGKRGGDHSHVALLAEGVDRNLCASKGHSD